MCGIHRHRDARMIVRLPTPSQGVPCQRSDVIATPLLHPDATVALRRRQDRVAAVPISDHILSHRPAHDFYGPALQSETCKVPQSAVEYKEQFPNEPHTEWKEVVLARSTPRVDDTVLVDRDGAAHSIAVGSPAWYAWLEDATTFAFAVAQGGFTARKERRGQTGWYWKAYRKQPRQVHRAYLGKSADLTLDRLNAIASDLAERVTEPPPHEAPSVLSPAPAPSNGNSQPLPAAPLPTGTLTFCFTDIEGSTQLWEQHPQAMPAALARHDAVVRQAIDTHSGVVFKTVGDGMHAVFARAADALAAALAVQRALHAEPWGETGPLRVRMALHTGAAELRDGDYFGPPLNRVARILALGHGGQILLSHATHDLVADDLPSQTTLRALASIHSRISAPGADLPARQPGSAQPTFRRCAPGSAPARSPPAASATLLATKLYIPPAAPAARAAPAPA